MSVEITTFVTEYNSVSITHEQSDANRCLIVKLHHSPYHWTGNQKHRSASTSISTVLFLNRPPQGPTKQTSITFCLDFKCTTKSIQHWCNTLSFTLFRLCCPWQTSERCITHITFGTHRDTRSTLSAERRLCLTRTRLLRRNWIDEQETVCLTNLKYT